MILFIAIKSLKLSLCALRHATANIPYNIYECSFVCLQLSWSGAQISERGQCRRRPGNSLPDRVPQLTLSLRTTIASAPSQSEQPHHAHAKSRSSQRPAQWNSVGGEATTAERNQCRDLHRPTQRQTRADPSHHTHTL